MKTAVSIPDDVYDRIERLARRTKRSRSRLFQDALGEYLARHDSDAVTDAMNGTIEELGAAGDVFVSTAASGILERNTW